MMMVVGCGGKTGIILHIKGAINAKPLELMTL
jgi:hypothetical protein